MRNKLLLSRYNNLRYNFIMIQIAIIGPTASGKSDLAINIAKKIDAYILSIDSLSIYKDIDIVSAKPSKEELLEIQHFGIDEIYPNQYFSVEIFIQLYKNIIKKCKQDKKNLIIVGGTSFYLKSLLDGLSILPSISSKTQDIVDEKLKNLSKVYNLLYDIDKNYMQKISPNDRYRIEKALLIYESSSFTPTEWFLKNPPQPIIKKIDIFNIDVNRDILRQRIDKRTKKMYEIGLIDEISTLEQKYSREPSPMKSIGIVETLKYLDAKIDLDEMLAQISTHTSQLAKRQQTFNKTQFIGVRSAILEDLQDIILSSCSNL
jgi:tRNA dimethylallyltransferase